MRAETAHLQDDAIAEKGSARARVLLSWLRRRPRDSIAALIAALAATAILVNALFLQSGPHPAPIFVHKPVREPAPHPAPAPATVLPRARPAEPATEPARPRPRADVVIEIQRELARRGFYEGTADGVFGPKTEAAVRDFEQMAGLKPAAEPDEALLAAIRRSTAQAKPAPASQRSDPIARLLAIDRRMLAVQRALADFGYGPVKPTGVYDLETRAAIERFERARRRPVTGKVSEQLLRDLAALTGRPIE
jgi:peptidoglycan hydrolase-like protein with peptidoglycan-binding domain